ncbi:MAG TPA: glycosyltransferase family 4 protein [Steroidobacteraceae bacterium]|nr:glycosyltransferase family 4 protein [Steroidobacteraceae bacterium]
MRILLAAPSYGVHGGIEAFVMALADWLARSTSHEVRVCFKIVGGRVSRDLQASLESLKLECRFARRGSAEILRNIRWCDILHANNCPPDIVLPAKLLRKPVILTIHNWYRGRRGLRNRLWLLCNRIADRRLYNSRFVWGTWEPGEPRRGSELMPTVSHLPQLTVPVEVRKGFCFVARLIENKGLDFLLKAYVAADIDKSQWPLVIAGDGPLRAQLESYLRCQQPAGIEYRGFVSASDKDRLIAGSRWLVAPANTREDMGLTPIEARSVSVPSIVTRDGGLPESAGPSALLCRPADWQELRARLEEAARMPDREYRERAMQAHASLQGYLRPLADYATLYSQLA